MWSSTARWWQKNYWMGVCTKTPSLFQLLYLSKVWLSKDRISEQQGYHLPPSSSSHKPALSHPKIVCYPIMCPLDCGDQASASNDSSFSGLMMLMLWWWSIPSIPSLVQASTIEKSTVPGSGALWGKGSLPFPASKPWFLMTEISSELLMTLKNCHQCYFLSKGLSWTNTRDKVMRLFATFECSTPEIRWIALLHDMNIRTGSMNESGIWERMSAETELHQMYACDELLSPVSQDEIVETIRVLLGHR